ncbi:PREDICTED: pectinesterase-like [Lupinus angustifolius]|uniref:pectinesterase-like n=1 Tax=Lupinus angustifolius TaxID=3871 RepID=UPI00092E1F72|nr:PREDICTED: pectinesterase-like [Lupinus angustifolius]
MKINIIVSVVSLILVVGVVIANIVINHKGNNSSTNPNVKANYSRVEKICQSAEQKDLCVQTLSTVNEASDPKEYVAAIVKATTESVNKAFNMSDKLSVEHGEKDQGIKIALDHCKDMLQFALDSLQLSTDLVGGKDIKQVHDQSADFSNWLTAVISHQQTCLDAFDNDKHDEKAVKELLNNENLDHVGKITGVALDLVADLTNILQEFGLQLELKPSSRRLLGAEEVDGEGLPTWLSASDRKLLAKVRMNKNAPMTTVMVAKDGSGQFRTIMEAIDAYPKGLQGRYVIHVKAGVYPEFIIVPKNAVNILMYGDGALNTVITGHKNKHLDGIDIMNGATFANEAYGFIAKGITFENTAGPEGHQAVALRNQGDMSAFFDCHIVGYQDTLWAQANRQFYRNCEISGTIDFIFGTSATMIQDSKIIVRKPNISMKQVNVITADGTQQRSMNSGIVLQGCEIVPEAELLQVKSEIKSYLGRPWKALARTVIMESNISDIIQPEGWMYHPNNIGFLNTLYYAEYGNTGVGADTKERVKWPGYHPTISTNEAHRFTARQVLQAGPTSKAEDWLRATGVPFTLGFRK